MTDKKTKMINSERFIEVAKKKGIIEQLQKEVNKIEIEIRETFADDVRKFFLSKGYEIEDSRYGEKKFINLRYLDENSTFDREPIYKIAGQNKLIVRFEWRRKKNISMSQIYWYPEKQTLEEFYNRRLKKTLILPIRIERRNKLNKINNNL